MKEQYKLKCRMNENQSLFTGGPRRAGGGWLESNFQPTKSAQLKLEHYIVCVDKKENWKCKKNCDGCTGRQRNGVNEEQMSCHPFFWFSFFAGCEIARWLINGFRESESLGGLLCRHKFLVSLYNGTPGRPPTLLLGGLCLNSWEAVACTPGRPSPPNGACWDSEPAPVIH